MVERFVGNLGQFFMKPCRLFCGLLILATCPVRTLADDENDWKRIGERHSYDACMRSTGGITVNILNCNGQEQQYQDRRINIAYRILMTALPADRRRATRLKERAWIKDRDNKCRQPPDSGTAGDINFSSCFLDETARRATELEKLTRDPAPP